MESFEEKRHCREEGFVCFGCCRSVKCGVYSAVVHFLIQVQAMSRQEIIQELEDAHVLQNYYIRAFPPELRDVTVRTSLLEEFPEICNHLIITGKGLSSLFDLIRPLRSK